MESNTFIIMYNQKLCEDCDEKASECAATKQCKIFIQGQNFRKSKKEDKNGKETV